MAFKLNKGEMTQRDELIGKLAEARADFDKAIDDYNAALDEAKSKAEAVLTTYNEVLEEAKGFISDIIAQAQEEYEEKSEKWQEGERGENARSWIEAWEELASEFEPIEVEFPDELEVEAEEHSTLLEDADTEAPE